MFFRGHSVEAAHHKFQKSLLGITWRDKVRNEDIGKKSGSWKLEDIIKERRLRWLGHVLESVLGKITIKRFKSKSQITAEKMI